MPSVTYRNLCEKSKERPQARNADRESGDEARTAYFAGTGMKTAALLLRVARNARPRALHENGQAMVEMALALPVLLLVLTGILTFGLAFNST
jgi:hypothetical protein